MSDVERQIVQAVRGLRPDQQRQVLEYARHLADPRHDDVEEHVGALLSEHALADWLSDEEDAAWAHLQQGGNASEVAHQTAAGQLRGLSGEEMLRFAGTISSEDLDEVERIIQEEFERTDSDEW